jgi:iron complex outermembrane recepter protein
MFMHLCGVGSNTPGAGLENPIALYVDGVYYANQSIGLFSFNNISQIEVFNGPQGTLFGRNSTGGLLQITTAEPTQEFQMKADAGASNFRGAGGDLYVSGGIAQDLAADVAIRGSRSDGYGTNFYNDQDIYAEPWNLAIRSKWVYTPDNWKATLIGDYSNADNSYNALAAIPGSYVIRPFLPAAALGTNPWNADTNVQPLVKQADMGGSLKIERDFGSMTLSNLVAGRRSSFETEFDDDGTSVPIEGLLIEQHDWQIADEVQLASSSGGPLKWVAGLYYFHDESEYDPTTASFAPDPTLNPLYPVGQLLATAKQDTASIAGFGQVSYDVTDQFAVTAGIRYTYEHHILNGASENGVLLVPGSPVVPVGPPIPEANRSFSDPTYRLALDYKITPDMLVFGSFNTGFKSGGYNASNPTDPAFAPEKLYAYEVGEKLEVLDHKLRLNSAVFYYDYKDTQEQKPEVFALGIINGSRAKLYGFDGQITAIPLKTLELSAGLSLLHTKFDSFPDAPISTRAA